jgi:hypothetical protein
MLLNPVRDFSPTHNPGLVGKNGLSGNAFEGSIFPRSLCGSVVRVKKL